MFQTYLKNQNPFLTDYLEKVISCETKAIPHSIILCGSNTIEQYLIALNIAKILNCIDNKNSDCNCLNCKWIKQNKHPCVLTITKCNNKQPDDDTKNVISISQIRMIKNSILNTSQYHRVFIFCDVENKKLTKEQEKKAELFAQTGFSVPNDTINNNNVWYPMPLNKLSLQDVAANALLKSIEEPPEKVTFIFLTGDKNDLLPTIVSRSQLFYVSGYSKENYKDEFIYTIMSNLYPNATPVQIYEIIDKLINYINEKEIKPSNLLCAIQDYLQELALANLKNKVLFTKIKSDIFHILEAQKMLTANVDVQNVFEMLFFSIFTE